MPPSESDKTVFISYRRDVSSFIARAIFMDLRMNGYDVFMDVESIDSGAFDTVILNQIAARAHFVLILTPGSIERCAEPNDWLRREIETAIDLGRNIVPLLINQFTFKGNETYLTGKLAGLTRYNALNVPHDYFDEAMNKLRSRFLKQTTEGTIVPTPSHETLVVEQKIKEAVSQPAPTADQINAEVYFETAQKKAKFDDAIEEAIAEYSEAIRLNPDYADAYHNRGNLYVRKADIESALFDFDRAIELNPEFAKAYFNRGLTHHNSQNYAKAVIDYTKAISLDSKLAFAYNNRGEAYFALGNYQQALEDFRKMNELKFGDQFALAGLAISRHAIGETDKAIKLWKSLLSVHHKNFRDIDWVKYELNWAEPLVEEARKLIAKLDG
jgi:tetratricopeptide (TPR) repeat protein